MTAPIWQDGVPANDAAAMADALEWLEVMAKLNVLWRPKNADVRERLHRCIADLRERLRQDEPNA